MDERHHRDLARAFMEQPPEQREAIAQRLGLGQDLPARHPAASYVILDRIREARRHDELRDLLEVTTP